jgi:uncharacterized protein (TIGR04255 family)
MNNFPILKNAPIKEAIFDIQVKFATQIDLKVFESIYNLNKERFPDKREKGTYETRITISKEGIPTVIPPSGGPEGYIFRSENEKKVIQVGKNGFTFNKLKPYESWDVFFMEAKHFWKQYVEITKPERIIRIALRYINLFEFPLPLKDFKEYILTIPEIAPKTPQGLENFFMRLTIPDPDSRIVAIITESMETLKDDQKLPIIFDLDVSEKVDFSSDQLKFWKSLPN